MVPVSVVSPARGVARSMAQTKGNVVFVPDQLSASDPNQESFTCALMEPPVPRPFGTFDVLSASKTVSPESARER